MIQISTKDQQLLNFNRNNLFLNLVKKYIIDIIDPGTKIRHYIDTTS